MKRNRQRISYISPATEPPNKIDYQTLIIFSRERERERIFLWYVCMNGYVWPFFFCVFRFIDYWFILSLWMENSLFLIFLYYKILPPKTKKNKKTNDMQDVSEKKKPWRININSEYSLQNWFKSLILVEKHSFGCLDCLQCVCVCVWLYQISMLSFFIFGSNVWNVWK